jgi:hypothetical protein
VAALVDLMDHAEKDETRLAACNALLDRGYGKPTQASEARVNTQVNTAALVTLFARVKNGAGAGDDGATDLRT